ncbi:hypothetical protein GYMLUDRAFT_774554 [Collybiopsis luxurians FD-317 M1]|uniref:CNH domain-containing protein n=1 Tax=Collybiopsis luxurians FD-317 M1 TaxID=944289 RepID=A0A0D0B1T8_9AGAR|nr:hypothetical protein GYMLUDRAFT_774554 [Collybiopsis luxurians FD-317 M1]
MSIIITTRTRCGEMKSGKRSWWSRRGCASQRVQSGTKKVGLELLALPAMHLQSYPSLLSAILASDSKATSSLTATSSNSADPAAAKGWGGMEHPDDPYLRDAIQAMEVLWRNTKEKTLRVRGPWWDKGRSVFQSGVANAKSTAEVWKYYKDGLGIDKDRLVFKPEEWNSLDLQDEHRSLIQFGKLLRQSDELDRWIELYVLLFDDCLVLTDINEWYGVTKFYVNRPIPLELLTIDRITNPPLQRSGPLRDLRSQSGIGPGHKVSNSTSSSQTFTSLSQPLVYPITLHHLGRLASRPMSTFLASTLKASPSTSGSELPPNLILYAESVAAHAEWGAKLQKALAAHRKKNRVFKVKVLNNQTFLTSAGVEGSSGTNGGVLDSGWSHDGTFTGKVTCSVPFNGRVLVAVGCADGVWIGFRHDPTSMRRILHLKMVSQCAVLDDYGIFLVLADKQLFAYQIEALVPSSPLNANISKLPTKLSGNEVHFFRVGTLFRRKLIIFMMKKGPGSIFRVLEPTGGKIHEQANTPSRFLSRSPKFKWLKVYRDFFLASESYDLIFLKEKIAILCSKGFEIMDMNNFKSVTVPRRDDPRFSSFAERSESCRPVGMFMLAQDEFLLCYNGFGIYIDKHGHIAREIIEWESDAQRAAVHAQYVLLFNSRFIEVRHLKTGRLAQIIPGSEIRCIWDGRGESSLSAVNDAQVYAVMNAPETVGGPQGPRAIVQQVIELLPIVS